MKIEHMRGWISTTESEGDDRHCLMHAGCHTFILERWKGRLSWIWVARGYITQDEAAKTAEIEVFDADTMGSPAKWLSSKIAEIRAKRWAGLLP